MDPALDKASTNTPDPAPAQGAPPPPPTAPGSAGAVQDEYQWRIFKEPRGFLRVIEFVLAICMFATTGGYSTSYSFTVSCDNDTTYVVDVNYPFNLEAEPLPAICNDPQPLYASADPSGSAQFFVAMGVLAMLYTLGISAWYVIFETRFSEEARQYTVDFVITTVFAILIFIASCAWAAGLNSLKYWTDFDKLSNNALAYKDQCSQPTIYCDAGKKADYSTLNVSIIFGFLNVAVWGGNLWFLYKETSWFRARSEGKAQGEQPAQPNTV